MRAVALFLASFSFALAACSDRGNGAGGDVPADSIAIINDGSQRDSLGRTLGPGTRPATIHGYLIVEGDSQLVAMQLFTPPASFPLKLSTYRPADMQTATATVGTNAMVTFTPELGGKTDPHAFIQFQTDVAPLAEDDAAGAALEALTQGIEVKGMRTQRVDRYPWATDAKSFRYESGERSLTGTVIVGRRAGRSYVFFIQYPEEFDDAMAPRVAVILTQWRWEDDFTYLIK